MKIHTLWAQRSEDYDGEYAPELLVAWDEHCMDSNGEGYDEEVEKAVERNGGLGPGKGLSAVREIIIEVPDEAIDKAFAIPQIKGSVVEKVE